MSNCLERLNMNDCINIFDRLDGLYKIYGVALLKIVKKRGGSIDGPTDGSIDTPTNRPMDKPTNLTDTVT